MLENITRCHGTGCPIKQQCLRHTASIPDNTLLSWAANLNHERAHICAYYTPDTPKLSPTARAVFEAFNSRFEWIEDGVPAPQFKALAAVFRAAASEVRKDEYETPGGSYAEMIDVDDLLDLADEFDAQ